MTDPFTTGGAQTLTIVLDRTGSMGGTIETMKKQLARYLIRRIARGKDDIRRLGLVTVDDHYTEENLRDFRAREEGDDQVERPGAYGPPFTSYGLTENLEEYMYWLHTVRLGEGEDWAEAFACGVTAALALDPEASVWVVTDAFPHGWDGGGGYSGSDSFPDGCPCGLSMPTRPLNVLMVGGSDIGELWRLHDHRVVQVSAWDFSAMLCGDEELESVQAEVGIAVRGEVPLVEAR